MSSAYAMQDNQPPALSNVASEQGLCAAMLSVPEIIDSVADLVSSEDFTDSFFGGLFSIVLREHSAGRTPTVISLKPFVPDEYWPVLAGMGRISAAAIGARDFAREIADFAKRRRLIESLQGVIGEASNLDTAIGDLIESADTAMSEALQRRMAVQTVTIAQAFDTTLKGIEDEASGLGPQGIRIDGLEDFNELTGDLRRGELMYLGGRPSMGKTAVALEIALGAARAGFGTSLMSLEMHTAELTARAMTDLVYQDGGRSPTFKQVRKGDLSDRDRELLTLARRQIDEWPLLITDPPSLNIGRLAMEIRRHRRRMAAAGQKLDLVIIDYLGLIRGTDKRAKRYEEVGEISRALKSIAKECDVAIVCLAQLNRECERRDDKRPMLSDLRDAGDVEQDADHVMFVFREEYYLSRSEPEPHDKKRSDWEIAMGHARDRIELIAAKCRNGSIGKRTCHFFGAYQAVRPSDWLRSR
jgi:replicative DNA helicase